MYTFESGYRFVPVDEDRCYLLGESQSHVFQMRSWVTLLNQISKGFYIDQIGEVFPNQEEHPLVHYRLNLLTRDGLIRTTSSRTISNGHWSMLDAIHVDIPPVFKEYGVAVYSTVPSYTAYVEDALSQVGLSTTPDSKKIRFIVCQNYMEPSVRDRIRGLQENGEPLYLMKLAEQNIWLGPLLLPNTGPCGDCLVHQLERNRPVECYLENSGIEVPYHYKETPVDEPAFKMAVGLGVADFVQTLSCVDLDATQQTITVLNLNPLYTEDHMVRKRPQCPFCGDPTLMETQINMPVPMTEQEVKYDQEGGVRGARPEDTFETYRHLIDPVTGIVAHLDPYSGKHHPQRPVYYGTYFVRPLPSRVSKEERFTKNSFGKGTSSIQAKTSALCEAIERHCAIYQGDEPTIRGTFQDLTPEAIHPNLLSNFSDAQYEDKHLADIDCSRQQVPPKYHDDQAIDWTPAWSLTHNCRRLLPANYCYTYFPAPPTEQVCPQNSNGHAAGNTPEEAVLQGVFELVERDSVAIWWYNRLRFPMIDLASFNDSYFGETTSHYNELGWDLWVLNLTADLEIPAVIALARHRRSLDYCVGLGCHLDGRLAVQRALTEIHQVFDPLREQPPVWNESDIIDPRFLLPDLDIPPVHASDLGRYRETSMKAYIDVCIQRLSRAGLEMIVQNQTRPDVGLSCMKVVVPGLRHMWKRLGPGRLYDVPVKMGWRKNALGESSLNPKPLLL